MTVATNTKGEIATGEPHYRYLEPKPYKHTRQLGIVGRNMTVWNLVAHVLNEDRAPEEVAKSFRLPLEAVNEALDYYRRNQAMIDAETEAIGRELGLK
jgi:uncharacterized protein (DUF433 family)